MDPRGRELRSVWLLLAVLAAVVPVQTARAQLLGDVDGNGMVAPDDLTTLAACIFNDAPSDCTAADVNLDGQIGSADVTALVDILEAPVAIGPVVTFFGLTNQDDTLLSASGTDPPVFSLPNGFGFSIVAEGSPGPSGAPVGLCTFGVLDAIGNFCTPSCTPDCSTFPDLQIQASNPLGNGSPTVCDRAGLVAKPGGVPGVDPITFDPTTNPNIISIVNDLACRFVDGTGSPRGRTTYPCVKHLPSEEYGFADSRSTVEFCSSPISSAEQFPPSADTTLTVRLRDVDGNVGAPAQIIVHVGP
jgi:hypothetical protein